MARKYAIIDIVVPGRDQGKTFLIREMPPSKQEKWAGRFLCALAKCQDLPTDIVQSGMAGVASVGFGSLSGIEWDDLEPLMDEIFGYIFYVPDKSMPGNNPAYPDEPFTRALVESDIEELGTRLKLRMEIFTLHTGFTAPDLLSKFLPVHSTAPEISQNTPTSQE